MMEAACLQAVWTGLANTDEVGAPRLHRRYIRRSRAECILRGLEFGALGLAHTMLRICKYISGRSDHCHATGINTYG